MHSLPETKPVLGGSGKALYLGRRVSVVQQSELHQDRDLLEIQDRLFRILQNKVKASELYYY